MNVDRDLPTRLKLCRDSLEGLSVGDALGAQFFVPGRSVDDLLAGRPPAGYWEWTDDTEMACSIVAELRDHESIDSDRLASHFAQRCEPYRGYGGGAVVILHRIRDGVSWQSAARDAFDGHGSCGNGAAMRVAPLGAFFAGDPDRAAEMAIRSAEVTHAHPEGVIGAVAVAVAAANAGAARLSGVRPTPMAFLDAIDPYVIDGGVRRGIRRAILLLDGDQSKGRVFEAAYELGNGSQATAQDTVPFALWVAATRLSNFPAAVTACVQAGGDVDTTAAIVGGVVASFAGVGDRRNATGVPLDWLAQREPLPQWCRIDPSDTRRTDPPDTRASGGR